MYQQNKALTVNVKEYKTKVSFKSIVVQNLN